MLIDNFAPPIANVNAGVRVAGDSLVIDSCNGTWGRGPIVAQGFLCTDAHGVASTRFAARGKNISCTYMNTNVVRADSVVAVLTHENKRWNLDGTIGLGTSSLYHEIFFDGIAVSQKKVKTTAKKGDEFFMNVKADFPITCSAELEIGRLFGGAATIVQAHTGGTMMMKGPTSDLQFSGAAKIIDGTVTYMNNTFNIVDGYVRQPSGKGFNPFISLTATAGITQTQGATLKDSITVKLTLSGEVSKLEVHLTSSPISYSESEILSLLTFGMTSFENSTAQGALVTGASSLLTRSVSGYASTAGTKAAGSRTSTDSRQLSTGRVCTPNYCHYLKKTIWT